MGAPKQRVRYRQGVGFFHVMRFVGDHEGDIRTLLVGPYPTISRAVDIYRPLAKTVIREMVPGG
jgi:hypothetical protein